MTEGKGRVYLVGAGPGDPDLITVRGLELIRRADVLVYDRLASSELLRHARPDSEQVYVGKKPKVHVFDQQWINALLIERAQLGRMVVRLKGGDPFVFGRGGEEALALAEAGIPFEVVPGVTAGLAAAASAVIPLTHRGLARDLTLVTGHFRDDPEGDALDYDALARQTGTLVFYMGIRNLASICANLIRAGLPRETPAAAIRWATTPEEHVIAGSVETLPGLVDQSELKPPAVVVIGRVVGLCDQLKPRSDATE